MNRILTSLVLFVALFPLAAVATGAEMGPLGGVVFLMGIGGVVLLQLVTLITYINLPVRWPRLLRVFLAVVLPPVVFGFIWLGLALS
jgi:hypothetical protein